MNRWKVCAALRRPNDMNGNSNNTNGVVIAVFLMSSGATGIWLYARTRSMVEKILLPRKDCAKSSMCRTGYRQGPCVEGVVISTRTPFVAGFLRDHVQR